MKTFLALVLLQLCLVVAAPSQQPTENSAIKIGTGLIQVDVTVTDKNGKAIRDLRPGEFEVYENGVKQDLAAFSFVSSKPNVKQEVKNAIDKVPVPSAVLRPENIKRTIAIVVDDITLSFESVHGVRESLKKFINEQMTDGDMVAIIRSTGGIGALQQFTNDKAQLLAAVDHIRWNRIGTNLASFAPLEGKVDLNMGPFVTPNSGAGDRMPEEVDKERDEYRKQIFASGTLGAINYVMSGMLRLPGRKSIILMSDGFKITTKDASGTWSLNENADAIQRLVRDANKASVVVYTIDPRGLQTLGFSAEDQPNTLNSSSLNDLLSERRADFKDSQESLIYLADKTGGLAVRNNNDLAGGIRRVLDDQSYYLLGFSVESLDPKDVEKRRTNPLVIKVTRPDAQVRYRSAFFGITDGAAGVPIKSNRLEQIYDALDSPFGVNEVNVRLNTLFAYNQKNRTFMRSFLHVNARDLAFKKEMDGKQHATIRVIAIDLGDQGTVADELDITTELQINEQDLTRVLRTGYVYAFYFPVKKPGAYQMRVAVRDEVNGKVGSANQFIEIPDVKRSMALSGIVLESLTDTGTITSAGGDDTARRDAAMGDTSLRRFGRGTALSYGFEIYNAANPADISVHIRVYRNGGLLYQGAPKNVDMSQQTDPKRLTMTGGIALGKAMESGDYILQVVATGANKKPVTQTVQFEVVE